MSPGSSAILNWEPSPGEHERAPVHPTTPRMPSQKACTVELLRTPETPRMATEVGEIRQLLQVHSAALVERMEALMLQQEQVITRLLETISTRNPREDTLRLAANTQNLLGTMSGARRSHRKQDSRQTIDEDEPFRRPSASKSTTFDLDIRKKMNSALVMQQFAKKAAFKPTTSVNSAASWLSNLVTWSRGTPKRETEFRCIRGTIEFANSAFFDGMCGLMIVVNAVLLGISTDMAARHANPDELPEFFEVAERIFSVWFLFELSVRMVAEGFVRFFLGKEWSWNIFDLTVVVLDLVETFARLIAGGNSIAVGRSNFTAMRILRVLRIVRTIRVIRLVRFFKELRMMVYSVLRSGLLLLWSMILLIIIIFMFSTYLTQIVTYYLYDYVDEHEVSDVAQKLRTYFGSLTFAGYMLFQCMSGGISWGEVGGPLLEIHWSNGLVFCFFIFFTVFAVLNIFTAIFVDTAFKSAMADRHEIIQEAINTEDVVLTQMRNFFEETDLDKSGTITLDELHARLQDPAMRAHLVSLGIEVNDAASIFRLLDIDKSGSISVEEFVFGCLQMQGTAKSIDLVTLIHQQKRLKDRLTTFFAYAYEALDQQQSFHRRLESLMIRGKIPEHANA